MIKSYKKQDLNSEPRLEWYSKINKKLINYHEIEVWYFASTKVIGTWRLERETLKKVYFPFIAKFDQGVLKTMKQIASDVKMILMDSEFGR